VRIVRDGGGDVADKVVRMGDDRTDRLSAVRRYAETAVRTAVAFLG
jgi:hypothetical protein